MLTMENSGILITHIILARRDMYVCYLGRNLEAITLWYKNVKSNSKN